MFCFITWKAKKIIILSLMKMIALSRIIPLPWACSSYNSDTAAPELEALEFRNTTLMLEDIRELSGAVGYFGSDTATLDTQR